MGCRKCPSAMDVRELFNLANWIRQSLPDRLISDKKSLSDFDGLFRQVTSINGVLDRYLWGKVCHSVPKSVNLGLSLAKLMSVSQSLDCRRPLRLGRGLATLWSHSDALGIIDATQCVIGWSTVCHCATIMLVVSIKKNTYSQQKSVHVIYFYYVFCNLGLYRPDVQYMYVYCIYTYLITGGLLYAQQLKVGRRKLSLPTLGASAQCFKLITSF